MIQSQLHRVPKDLVSTSSRLHSSASRAQLLEPRYKPFLLLRSVRQALFSPRRQRIQIRTEHLLRSKVQAAAEGRATVANGVDTKLEHFTSWLCANGAFSDDIGSKVALYEGEDGERGILAVQSVVENEVLFRIPMRLALTDHPGDAESNSMMYSGAPWGTRMAAKLLREKAKGKASKWWPYLQMLPTRVPTPLETFTWDDIQLIEYPPLMEDLYYYHWLVSDAYSRCSPEAIGHANEEEFQWAMAVVHSRTFGNMDPSGSVSTRMTVPLVDMINHAGLQYSRCPGSSVEATGNARWDLLPVRAEHSNGHGSKSISWEMVVKATTPIAEGMEVLMSYGDRSNDDFFLYYGFVPPRNPEDDVTLFAHIDEALQWYYDTFEQHSPDEQEDDEQRRQRYESALSASTSEDMLFQSGSSCLSDERLAAQHNRLRLLAGNRMDGRLIAAWKVVSCRTSSTTATEPTTTDNGASATAESVNRNSELADRYEADALARVDIAVLLRCWQLVGQMSRLDDDLAALCVSLQDRNERMYFEDMQRHYGKVMKSTCSRLAELASRPDGCTPGEMSSSSTSTCFGAMHFIPTCPTCPVACTPNVHPLTTRQEVLATTYRAYKKMILWDAVDAIAHRL